MAFRLPFLEINTRVLVFLMIFTFPALALGGLVVIGVGQAELRGAFGGHLSQIANRTAAATDAYVFRRVIDVSELAKVPTLRGVSASSSQETPDPDRVLELDAQWQLESSPPPSLIEPMDNPASRFLRDIVGDDPIYREILLTDRHGRLVAASGISTDYFQGDEEWWREVAGTGRAYVGDVVYDESARVFGLEMSVPVSDPSGGGMAGVLKVIVDVRELLAAVSGTPTERSAEAVLIRRDGSIVHSRQTVDPETEFYAALQLRDYLTSFGPGDPQAQTYFRARSSDGTDQLVAIAQTQLAASYPNLPWVVAVSSPETDLFTPIRNQARNLLFLFAIVAVLMLALVLWLSSAAHGPSV